MFCAAYLFENDGIPRFDEPKAPVFDLGYPIENSGTPMFEKLEIPSCHIGYLCGVQSEVAVCAKAARRRSVTRSCSHFPYLGKHGERVNKTLLDSIECQ